MNIGADVCTVSVCVIFEPVHDPPCSALNPCKGTLVEPVTNCRRRPLLSSLKASTACQNHRTTLLSLVQCFRRVLVFQSARSIFPSPPMINCKRGRKIKKQQRWPLQTWYGKCFAERIWPPFSLCSLKMPMAPFINVFIWTFSVHSNHIICTSSSLWSKGLRRCWGMSSVNPFCRARNWASIPRINLQFT